MSDYGDNRPADPRLGDNDLLRALLDDEDDDLEPTCANGCPDGSLGVHKMSCRWSGVLVHEGGACLVLGESPDGRTLCISSDGGHLHVAASTVTREPVR